MLLSLWMRKKLSLRIHVMISWYCCCMVDNQGLLDHLNKHEPQYRIYHLRIIFKKMPAHGKKIKPGRTVFPPSTLLASRNSDTHCVRPANKIHAESIELPISHIGARPIFLSHRKCDFRDDQNVSWEEYFTPTSRQVCSTITAMAG